MIIIGNKYNFLTYELEILQKKEKIIKLPLYSEKEIMEIVNNHPNELIIINTPYEFTKKIIKKLSNKNVTTIEEFLEKKFQKYYVPYKSEKHFPVMKPYTKFQYFQKRVIDYLTGGTLLILAFPIMAYSAYRIKKESPDGPVFFTQYRIGKDGKPFKCYKFRSMRTDIKFFNKYTQENDPRIFPWGAFMRKTRIDELPQLINVFKGEMHMIGPRAEWDELVKEYEKTFPFYHERHKTAPGITGWAQVNYHYGQNIEDTRQKLMYDFYYIKNWSLGLEIKTIIKTILVMLGKKGL